MGLLSSSTTFGRQQLLQSFGCCVPENVLDVLSIPFREMTACRGLGLLNDLAESMLERFRLDGVVAVLTGGATRSGERQQQPSSKLVLPSHCLIAMRKALKRLKPPCVPPVQNLELSSI